MIPSLNNLTPMMRQYFEVKSERPDTILLMRVGDFYEAYGDDAELIAGALEITLTGREDKQSGTRIPMAGVPYHAVERYVARLISKSYKVAICDQVEDPKLSKGLVKRRVTRILTPGTVVEDSMLDAKSNNYLVAAITDLRRPSGIGVIDVSTGEFLATEVSIEDGTDKVIEEICRLAPSECLLLPGMDELAASIKAATTAVITFHEHREIHSTPSQCLLNHFGTTSLTGYGCEELTSGLEAASLLLDYVKMTNQSGASHIRSLATYSTSNFMVLDSATRRNLELTRSLADGARSRGLVNILDRTVTSMGGRLLRKWFDQPLLSRDAIRKRQTAIKELAENALMRGDLRDALRRISDLERLIARICGGQANARDLVALKDSLYALHDIKTALSNTSTTGAIEPYKFQASAIPNELLTLMEESLINEPPLVLRDGGLIKPGYDKAVDSLRDLRSGGKEFIARLEQTERERTGIKTLKVGYNNVFGYYIEITRSNAAIAVPEDYFRKQTTVNAERYITPVLKEYESQILGAEERLSIREYELFTEIRTRIADHYTGIVLNVASAIAHLDVYGALAEVALHHQFRCPDIDESNTISIRSGRHPVVESLQSGTRFVPNDTLLDDNAMRVHIITGPNSAGKSTYLRQVALIVLLAQIGSYIPAESATIGLVDRIFTRVGAHDDLASGQSTFMVEMNETANILNNATCRSLVLLDEVGRGTSTYDGLALAWAVAEHLLAIGAKTLFATHYHHLNDLEKLHVGVRNYRVAVKEQGDHIVWLRKITPGGTDRSYGIQVAKLAGVPEPVVCRAREILKSLELETKSEHRIDIAARTSTKKLQLTLFEAENNPAIQELKTLDLETISPMEALTFLYELQRKLS